MVGTTNEIESIHVMDVEYDLSKMKLEEVLKKLAKEHNITWRSEGRCLLLRSKSYDVKNSPLSRRMTPFKYSGKFEDIVCYLFRKNSDDVSVGWLEVWLGGHRGELPVLTVSCDSRKTIEDVLLDVANRYGISWTMTVTSFPQTRFSPIEMRNDTNKELILPSLRISTNLFPASSVVLDRERLGTNTLFLHARFQVQFSYDWVHTP